MIKFPEMTGVCSVSAFSMLKEGGVRSILCDLNAEVVVTDSPLALDRFGVGWRVK